MGKRSKAPDTDKDIAKLTLKELNGRIRLAEYRATKMKLSGSLKKSAMKRLDWLEHQREHSTAFQRQNAVAFDREA
jgi:hypothetical protein